MAQIQSPETYADGQQVTAARLNNQTNGAILLPGAITDQTNITANTVASGDSILLYDLSATALREANVSDVLGSNLPVTTSAITAGANSDIVVTPNDGVIVTGQAYTSGDGLTVTVTSTAHTLTVGQVILVTAAAAGYNGTFRVATIATNSFTYVMTTAATAGSSTLSYTKKGLIRNTGSQSVAGSMFVDGTLVVASSTVIGNQTVAGNLVVTGTTTFNGIASASTPAALTNTTQVATTAFVRADNNVKAWVSFNGTGTVAINASFNVSSVTDNAAGDYTINFTTAISDANYAVVTSDYGRTGFATGLHTAAGAWASAPTTKTTTAARIGVGYSDGTLDDVFEVHAAILR